MVHRAVRSVLLVSLAVAAMGLLVALGNQHLVLAGLLALALFGAGVVAYVRHRVHHMYLAALSVGLLGYAVMGRGFAYVGFPPIYVGEVLLILGAAVLLARAGWGGLVGDPLTWVLLLFMAVGATATIPHLGTYGVDAVRDAAQWGYGVFALVVAGLVRDVPGIRGVLGWYRRVVPWLLLGPVTVFGLLVVLGDRLPLLPFSGVPIVGFKGGDVAVHLAGVLGFVVLGLHRALGAPARALAPSREWFWWGFWLVAFVTTLTVRASFVTLAFTAGVLFVLRPTGRWWKLLAICGVLLAVAVAFEVEVTVGKSERPLSVANVVTMVRSIFEPVGTGAYDGSRGWRLQWWSDIVGYTILGEYFWTGKGYGINLADADGFEVDAFGSLRSPHNGHLTLLARSGVPGAAMWLLLLTSIAISLFRAFRRRLAEGRTDWAHLNLWLLAYLLAFVTNGAFDVYLEGPMGGIWFWSVVGFALASLRVQRQPDALLT